MKKTSKLSEVVYSEYYFKCLKLDLRTYASCLRLKLWQLEKLLQRAKDRRKLKEYKSKLFLSAKLLGHKTESYYENEREYYQSIESTERANNTGSSTSLPAWVGLSDYGQSHAERDREFDRIRRINSVKFKRIFIDNKPKAVG